MTPQVSSWKNPFAGQNYGEIDQEKRKNTTIRRQFAIKGENYTKYKRGLYLNWHRHIIWKVYHESSIV